MSEIYDNAISSLILGVEDYQSDDDRRMISALRNFYAGVLLLGKACLLNAADVSDPMEVLAARFTPKLNTTGEVVYENESFTTVDLQGLQNRFKGFGLVWPQGDIKRLQKLRNNSEHYHVDTPKETIQQAISECFPLVAGFLEILEKDPTQELGATWEIMIKEKALFKEQLQKCQKSFSEIEWKELVDASKVECLNCQMPLLAQEDEQNSDPALISAKCLACSHEHDALYIIENTIEHKFGVDNLLSAIQSNTQLIYTCPECSEDTYVYNDEWNMCLYCLHEMTTECSRCSNEITPDTMSYENNGLCDYCQNQLDKVMRE